MTLAPGSIPVIPRGVRLHRDRVRDRWVLLAPERVIALDPIGYAILARIDGIHDFATLVSDLAQAHGAEPAQVEGDVAEFIAGLADRRMIEVTR